VKLSRASSSVDRTYGAPLSEPLAGQVPQSLSALVALKELRLARHDFGSSLPASWSTLTALETLDMEASNVTGGRAQRQAARQATGISHPTVAIALPSTAVQVACLLSGPRSQA
jgi:hypothetical protein